MKSSTKNLISFGEILWDMLPTGAQVGGAPLNVALRAQSLGMQTKIISKIGRDKMGMDILGFIADRGTDTHLIQQSEEWPTGQVNVELDAQGAATYNIVYPSAWDKIDLLPEAIEEVAKADAFVFGTLATRDEHSKTTLFKLLEKAPYKVFDINLRPPHYDFPLIFELARKSNLLKLNDEELWILAQELGSKSENLAENILFLPKKIACDAICITKGAKGAVLYIENQFYSHPGYKVKVADTVGAGDSFLATLIYHLLDQSYYQKAIEMACAMGSIVASKVGASSFITDAELEKLKKQTRF